LTGGVGPTNDDITKQVLCQYFGTSLVFSNEVLENINAVFAKRNIVLNELTKNQALVPKDCKVIQNRVGTAPILWFEKNEKVLVSMPGVPFEMKTAMKERIIPMLRQKFQLVEYIKESFIVADISESALAILLADFEKQLPENFSLAYLPSFGLIRLRLFVRGREHKELMKLQSKKLKKKLGKYFVAKSEDSLETLLGKKLKKLGCSLSTAESCTGGYISHKITTVSGASDYFYGSVVSYNNDVKNCILDINIETLRNFGAVSKPVVEQMARNVATKMNTNCSIAVSGIMGPKGGSRSKPIGTVWVATKYNEYLLAKAYNVNSGNRNENISRTANLAMLQIYEKNFHCRINSYIIFTLPVS
jgi:nicotinamide-nucleotide amidase